MTRREGLLALAGMFGLFVAGVTWQFGPFGLIACALLGAAGIVFGFERVSDRRAEAVPDTVPDALLAAFERDLPL